jgi:hypothetical protein
VNQGCCISEYVPEKFDASEPDIQPEDFYVFKFCDAYLTFFCLVIGASACEECAAGSFTNTTGIHSNLILELEFTNVYRDGCTVTCAT